MVSALSDILICLRFFSRLPLPATRREEELGAGGFAAAAAMVPVAGALIGCVPALALAAAHAAAVPHAVAALLALVALVIVTGALHEDGLADCADGFGGGRTSERKLEIMRDSRIGTYAACAIGLSLALRGASLAVLLAVDSWRAAMVLVAAAGVSRTLCLLPLVMLPPARATGMGAATRVPSAAFGVAAALSFVLFCLPLAAGASPAQLVGTLAAAWLVALSMVAVARAQIGGQTGDVAGATQQVSEVAILVGCAAGLSVR